nr:hypothetical protein [Tanacetum cinerariifolium]
MNQNQIGRTVFDIDEESDVFYFQKAIEYHEWLLQQEAQPQLNRTPIFRDREDAERRLRANYFDDHSLNFSAALSSSSIQHHQLLPGSTMIFTGSSKHLVFFFKLHGSINSKANS